MSAYTEAEAKRRWCPFAREMAAKAVRPVAGPREFEITAYGPAVNRSPATELPACLGSRCMAWRWKTQNAYDIADGRLLDVSTPQETWTGYCGLAGRVAP